MIVLAMLLAAGAPAPIYLACELQQDTGKLAVEVAVDEANQRVTIALPSGRTVTRDALFAPDEIKVPDGPETWYVDRVNLKFKRSFAFMPSTDTGESGSCKIKPSPAARAF